MAILLRLICFLLGATSSALCFIKTPVPEFLYPLPAVIAFFLSFILVKKYTGTIDILLGYLVVFSAGFSTDHITNNFPFFTIAVAACCFVFMIRTTFIKQMGYVKFTWVEPALLLAGVGFFVAGNLMAHSNWTGWSYPGLFVAMNVMMLQTNMKSMKAFRDGGNSELKVEIGQPAPDFLLPDENGKMVSISGFKDVQPVLLLFVRGDWCPTCHIMLRTYERNNDQFKRKNVCVMGIGPDPQGVNKEMVEKMSLTFHILADDKQEALLKYGISFVDAVPGKNYEVGSPLPASILIDKKGIVRHICRADRAGEFLNPMQIFAVLEKMDQ